MTDNAISYEWHTVSRRVRYMMSALLAIACVWVAFHANTKTLVFISIVLAFGAVAALADQRVRIDPTTLDVSRDITIGRVCLWSSHQSLQNFSGIGAYRLPSGTPQAPADLVHVGLRRFHWQYIAIRYFNAQRGQPCPEAEAFAHSLEATTNLKFHEVV